MIALVEPMSQQWPYSLIMKTIESSANRLALPLLKKTICFMSETVSISSRKPTGPWVTVIGAVNGQRVMADIPRHALDGKSDHDVDATMKRHLLQVYRYQKEFPGGERSVHADR